MMRLMVMMMEEPRHRDPSTPQWSHRERQVLGVSSSLEAMLAAPEVNVENLGSRLVIMVTISDF